MQVLLRALRDFNLGKLTADDTGIFMGLLNDLFPKTVELVPRAIDREFEAKVSLSIGNHCLDILFFRSCLTPDSCRVGLPALELLGNWLAGCSVGPRPPLGSIQLESCPFPTMSHR